MPQKKLTAKDIARAMMTGEREAAEAGLGYDDFDREPLPRRGEKFWEVSWFAPQAGKRVIYRRPVLSANQRGAISEVKALHKQRLKSKLTSLGAEKLLKGATNYTAVRNPK